MATTFEHVTLISAPAQAVFDLKRDVQLHPRSLPGTGETATTAGDVRLGLGDEAAFTGRHFFLTWRFNSRITAFDPPRRFVDEQVDGPFAFFRHEHEFMPVEAGTRMVDRVTFAAPFGSIGRLAETVALNRHLRTLIARRADFIKTAAEHSD